MTITVLATQSLTAVNTYCESSEQQANTQHDSQRTSRAGQLKVTVGGSFLHSFKCYAFRQWNADYR